MRRPTRDSGESLRGISRRALVLGAAQFGFMGVLAARMRSMQVEEAEQYRLLADENRINLRLLAPSRGLVFDRNGIPLAVNEQNYRVVMVREDAGDIREVLERLRRLIPLSDEDIERIWQALEANPGASATVNLVEKTVSVGDIRVDFEIDEYTRWRLLEGLDDIGLTLRDEKSITDFEAKRESWRPKTLPAKGA